MTEQVFDDQPEVYEQRERLRRRDFIERMEQKLEFKVQAYREQRTRHALRASSSRS